MITINATGDTTLHTAGKYCAEDILVKVPAGGSSGGASVEVCEVTIIFPDRNTYPYLVSYTAVDDNGNLFARVKYSGGNYDPSDYEVMIIDAACGTSITVYMSAAVTASVDNGECIYEYQNILVFRVDGDGYITLQ